jgi:23S rRNA pseudouridine1911/1915/1917 synthase
MHLLQPGCIVLIASFDDVPEHQFRISKVYNDDGIISGMALTGPFAGEYGEPDFDSVVRVIKKCKNQTKTNSGRVYPCGKKPIQPPQTLLNYLVSLSTLGFKRSAWERRILRGVVYINGVQTLNVDEPLNSYSRVTYHRPPWKEPLLTHELEVLHQDEHFFVLNKPSGLPTMPSQTFHEYTVLNIVRTAGTFSDAAAAPPQPVHRLGVGTSGVLLVATSLQARASLSCAIRERRVTKVYRALVKGADLPDAMRISCPIGPVPFPIGGGSLNAACPLPAVVANSTSTSTDDTSNTPAPVGKHSLSLVRVVSRNWNDDTAVVEVEIPTGRPHQIRIHMAYCGHPLVGDPLYLTGGVPDCTIRAFPKRMREEEDMDTDEENDNGSTETNSLRVALPRDVGYTLHAYKITFEHPTINGKWVTVTAPPPVNVR